MQKAANWLPFVLYIQEENMITESSLTEKAAIKTALFCFIITDDWSELSQSASLAAISSIFFLSAVLISSELSAVRHMLWKMAFLSSSPA